MDYKQEIIEQANQQENYEVCGFGILGRDKKIKITQVENKAKDPKKDFSINPSDFVKARLRGRILFFYHSHPFTPEDPTEKDIKSSENCKIPCLIYSRFSGAFYLYIPDSYKINNKLVERPWIDDFYECTTLVQDFYCLNYGLKRNKFMHNHIFDKNNRIFDDKIKNMFEEVSDGGFKYGDLLVFRIVNQNYYHFGIYYGNGVFLHHPQNMFSEKTELNTSWQRRLCNIYRLKDCEKGNITW
jgi:proteasome lid subunit RPN8/RPN11